jgi:hypothetical protein
MKGEAMPVYHFTDTLRLPWIIHSGQLRPGRNKLGGYTSPEFVWASTDPRDDRSASITRGEPYRDGRVRHIRFTLPQDRFIPWREVPMRYPSWTSDQVARLEHSGKALQTSPDNWWCRAGTLSLEDVISIDWRSYRCNQWKPLPGKGQLYTDLWPMLVYRVEQHCFASEPVDGPRGEQGYAIPKVDMLYRTTEKQPMARTTAITLC